MIGEDNLDCMSYSELLSYAALCRFRVYSLGPYNEESATLLKLMNYATLKATAVYFRECGEIVQALLYEEMCETVYKWLPENAKW